MSAVAARRILKERLPALRLPHLKREEKTRKAPRRLKSAGDDACPTEKSVQPEFAVDRFQLRRLDQPGVRDRHRMQRPFQRALPEFQEARSSGKFGQRS